MARLGILGSLICTSFFIQCFAMTGLKNVTGTTLRILPLGASITAGIGSTDGNGYRLDLLELLQPDNNATTVGTQTSGSTQYEGRSGAILSAVAGYAKASLPYRPNVVLVHAGTNDMLSDSLAANATKNMGDLIDEIVAACPDATVVIAQLIPNRVNTTEARLVVFNAAIPRIVAARANAGKKVMYYNFFNKLDTATDYSDDTHPNDQGYEKMALGWYAAISQAYDNGWIEPPVDPSPTRRAYIKMRPMFP